MDAVEQLDLPFRTLQIELAGERVQKQRVVIKNYNISRVRKKCMQRKR